MSTISQAAELATLNLGDRRGESRRYPGRKMKRRRGDTGDLFLKTVPSVCGVKYLLLYLVDRRASRSRPLTVEKSIRKDKRKDKEGEHRIHCVSGCINIL